MHHTLHPLVNHRHRFRLEIQLGPRLRRGRTDHTTLLILHLTDQP